MLARCLRNLRTVPIWNAASRLPRHWQSTHESPKLVSVFIDDTEVHVEPGTTVLEACAEAGIEIPRFCYHQRLSVAGNCRMCLVEVEKSAKPVASCAMPVMPGMRVKPHSEISRKAREGVMEFLLVNHPLDCPICDQGGECDLQDQSMAFGSDRSRFVDNMFGGKRAVEDKDIGPLIKTIMTRCIHCTRCVRFANEVAGISELGTTGRGSDMQIGTYVERMLLSELSGNVIDLCPVGALTAKPYAFAYRSWELRRTDTIDVHDAIGSNISVNTRAGQVMRILPRVNDDINEEWITDKARFAFDGLTLQRITSPMIKNANGRLEKCNWEDALLLVTSRLNSLEDPTSELAGITGALADCESMVALKDLFNKCGSEQLYTESIIETGINNDLRSAYLMNTGISAIEEADLLLIIGANPRFEAALVNSRIRKGYIHNELDVAVLGPKVDLTYDYLHLGDDVTTLKSIITGKEAFLTKFKQASKPIIIVGQSILKRSDAKSVLTEIYKLSECNTNHSEDWKIVNILHTKANQVGAMDLGYNTSGLAASNLKKLRLLYLLGTDSNNVKRDQLSHDCLIVFQGHHGDSGANIADIILPGAAYTEKNATFVNTEGRAQQTLAAVNPPLEAREDWAIIRAVSELTPHPLPYDTIEELRSRMGEISPTLNSNFNLEYTEFYGLTQEYLKETISSSQINSLLPVCVEINSLEDFYMTDVISKASRTMAQCIQAVKNEKMKVDKADI